MHTLHRPAALDPQARLDTSRHHRTAAKQKFSPRRRAAKRLREMVRLARYRQEHGIDIDMRQWLFVGLHVLALQKGHFDFPRLNEWLKLCRLGYDDADPAEDAMANFHRVDDYLRPRPAFRWTTAATLRRSRKRTTEPLVSAIEHMSPLSFDGMHTCR